MQRVRIGVIGLGTMGRHYVKIYSDHPLAEVAAVSAPQEEQVGEIRALSTWMVIQITGGCLTGTIWMPW